VEVASTTKTEAIALVSEVQTEKANARDKIRQSKRKEKGKRQKRRQKRKLRTTPKRSNNGNQK